MSNTDRATSRVKKKSDDKSKKTDIKSAHETEVKKPWVSTEWRCYTDPIKWTPRDARNIAWNTAPPKQTQWTPRDASTIPWGTHTPTLGRKSAIASPQTEGKAIKTITNKDDAKAEKPSPESETKDAGKTEETIKKTAVNGSSSGMPQHESGTKGARKTKWRTVGQMWKAFKPSMRSTTAHTPKLAAKTGKL